MKKIAILFSFLCCISPLKGKDGRSTRRPSVKVPDVTNGLDINGINVCSFTETISTKVKVAFEQQTLTKVYYQTCCTFFCFTRCNKTRLAMKKVISYRLRTVYVDRKNYHCCSGWGRTSDQENSCSIPKCGVQCQNGGSCIGPDTCTCAKGFTGKYCTLDVDECNDASINKCEQYCINMISGFRCGCKRGYNLNADKETCSDIDECSNPNPKCTCTKTDGVCNATCINSPGSFACKCKRGYFLNSARECEDINECFTNAKVCDQQCINTPGSYRCGCANGFQFNGTACVDIDECALNNGGCSDKCQNLDGSYVCTCPDGFYLTRDQKTCKVIEPTMKNKIICQSEGVGFLDCDKFDEKIIIIDAMYGRLTTQHCQTGNYTQNTRCKADNPIQHLTSCNGKSSCVFFFDEAVFGDPCPGIEKYMQIVYDCIQ